jgi:hypothetical protein
MLSVESQKKIKNNKRERVREGVCICGVRENSNKQRKFLTLKTIFLG